MGVEMPPLEGNADLPYFTPGRAHLLLWEVYGDFPDHNNGLYLDGGVVDDAIWKCRCRRISTQSDSWYDTPSGAVGCRFTAMLEAEWRGVLGRSWNSERPLVFAHVILTKMLGVRQAR